MEGFIRYIYNEVKNKRLTKPDAIDLIHQFQSHNPVEKPCFLHPLLHLNTSDFSEQRFSSTFTGEEFFLADHVVNGRRVLPGVAYLEMVRAAVEAATDALELGNLTREPVEFRLKNVVWARPIVVGIQPVRVHIGLFPEENNEISYKIYSSPGGSELNDIDPEIYSQGRVVPVSNTEVPTLDLKDLQARCNQKVFSAAEVYAFFKMIGIDYGPGHQGVEKIYIGPGRVLAKISLPASISNTREQYILHPSIMDGAFQASIGLMMGSVATDGLDQPKQPSLPFVLQELEIYSRCTSPMWALIRSSGSKTTTGIQKLDIDLCDATGKIGVRVKGYSSRVLDSFKELDNSNRLQVTVNPVVDATTFGTLLVHPNWKERMIAPEIPVLEYDRQLIIFCELKSIGVPEQIAAQIDGIARHSSCLSLQSTAQGAGRQDTMGQSIDQRFQIYTAQVFEEILSVFKDKTTSKVLVQIIINHQGEQQLFNGLSGLLITARSENPKLIGQLIEVETTEDMAELKSKLLENSRAPEDYWIRYQAGKRYVVGWDEIEVQRAAVKPPWKDGGIYLITGGAGGLGMIFAKEIAHQVKKPTLILIGRSKFSGDNSRHPLAEFRELEQLGARIEYQAVDVTDRQAVGELIQNIVGNFGSLNGIIHSAGIIKDNFIIKKSQGELLEVLAPKVTGLLNLDIASRDLPLDFFILFSSISGSLGNPGQADYAAANAFMDAYAGYRNSLVVSNQRQGRTLAINWPLWREGGMRVDPETEKIMFQNSGLIPMSTRHGIAALYQSFASGHDRVSVMEGNLARLKHTINLTSNQFGQSDHPILKPGLSSLNDEPPSIGFNTGNFLPDKVKAASDSNHIEIT